MISIILCAILLITSVFSFLLYENISLENAEKRGVFVGVTYCGDSVAGGKLLIDKVKQYSNLFVLQSASLQRDFKSVDELGDYAVASGLYFLPYFGTYVETTLSAWLKTRLSQKWGDHLIGIYYGDEPGGKMLDGYAQFEDEETGYSIISTMLRIHPSRRRPGRTTSGCSTSRREGRLKVRSPGATDSIQRCSASFHGVR